MKLNMAFVLAVGCTASDADQFVQPSAACRDHATTVFSTQFVGSQFAAFDGAQAIGVTIIETIGTGSIMCRAADRQRIANGAFSIRVDNQRDDAVYPRIGVFIDSDDNGVCDADRDLVWTMYSGAASPGDVDLVEITVEDLALRPDAEGCAMLR